MSPCPPDPEETAEAYCRDRLSPEDAKAYEDHYLGCPHCLRMLETAQAFIRAMKAAAWEPRKPS